MTHLKIFSVGGTIDKIYFDAASDFEIGEPQISDILREVGAAFDHSMTALMRKDSLDMTDADRERIASAVRDEPCRHILITHGTDTMTQTAAVLEPLAKERVVILTGAMMPARFRQTDAIFNIGCAIGALATQSPGVYIAMSGRVFRSGTVRKNREKGVFEEFSE